MAISKHPLCTDATDQRLAEIPPDSELIRRLQADFSRLGQHANAFSERFYAILFKRHPEVRSMFPADMTLQKQKLIQMLTTIVENLTLPALIRPRLHELGQSHVGYGAIQAHYPLVQDAMVSAMAETVGSAWTPEMTREWNEAIRQVAAIMLEGVERK